MTKAQLATLTPEMVLPPPPTSKSYFESYFSTKGISTYDEIVLASAALDSAEPARRVLIVVGADLDEAEISSTAIYCSGCFSPPEGRVSKANDKDALAAAQRSGTAIFGIDSSSLFFARDTGGYLWRLMGQSWKPSYNIWSRFPLVFENIRLQMDNMYSVSYLPASPKPTGEFRSVELKMIPSERKWKIDAPKKYYVRASSAPPS